MGEVVYLNDRSERTATDNSVEQVRRGVFVMSEYADPEQFHPDEYVTALDFGEAGEKVGKTYTFGQGVMRSIALKMLEIDRSPALPDGATQFSREDLEQDAARLSEIRGLLDDPIKIRQGSRDRVMLGRQLVHDVWALRMGSELVHPGSVPRLDKIGHRVVSQIVTVTLR